MAADATLCANSTYVALLAGRQQVPGAECLPRQLRRVGSVCPVTLVYDDRDESLVPAMDTLANAYGRSGLVSLSWLMNRASAPVHHGRRLFARGQVGAPLL